ncbi:hypothetical protein P3T22_003857 [Paraburkholderia sp. GAS348]
MRRARNRASPSRIFETKGGTRHPAGERIQKGTRRVSSANSTVMPKTSRLCIVSRRRRLQSATPRYTCRICGSCVRPRASAYSASAPVSSVKFTSLRPIIDDRSFRQLLIVACDWASELPKTIVKICAGEFSHGGELPVVCIGETGIDPRLNIWRRAREALHDERNLWPQRPYPRLREATVFITRDSVPRPNVFVEARLDIIVAKGHAHTSAVFDNYPRCDLLRVRVNSADDVVTVVRKVLDVN